MINGGLYFLFLYLIGRYLWRSAFPLLRFFDKKLSFHILFFSAPRAHPSQEYDEQKAAVVVAVLPF